MLSGKYSDNVGDGHHRRVLSSYKNAYQQVCGAINARSDAVGRVVILQPESKRKIRQDEHKEIAEGEGIGYRSGAWRRQSEAVRESGEAPRRIDANDADTIGRR